MEGRRYGIDLGTSYSCIAALDSTDSPQVIRDELADADKLASAAYVNERDEMLAAMDAAIIAAITTMLQDDSKDDNHRGGGEGPFGGEIGGK